MNDNDDNDDNDYNNNNDDMNDNNNNDMNVNNAIKLNFTLEQIVTESYRSKIAKDGCDTDIYDVKFFGSMPNIYLASCGHYIIFVYQVNIITHTLDVKLSYCDQDENESFYCLEYSECNKTPMLLTAGKNGIVKGINCQSHEIEVILQGHGNAINDLRIHPVDDGLLLSASKDESIRLWNLRTSVCIAIFAGIAGHRDEVISIDIHLEGNCFISAGMDNSIKIWNLEDPHISHAIDLSYTAPRRQNNLTFLTISQQWPVYSTDCLHRDYVDCVRFVGNAILSKSTKNRIVLWLPDPLRFKGAPVILREYATNDCGNWFTRFGVSQELDIFALGNTDGKVSIFSISAPASVLKIKPIVSSEYIISDNDGRITKKVDIIASKSIKERFESLSVHRPQTTLYGDEIKKKAITRQSAFEKSGSYLAIANQDGSINLWHIERVQYS